VTEPSRPPVWGIPALLAAVLAEAERTRLTQLGHGDGLPPFLIIESEELVKTQKFLFETIWKTST
jgi:hypothetical protein